MTQVQNKTPDEFILDPTMSNFLLLDQISRRTGKVLDAQIETIRLLQENQKTLSLLALDTSSILKELKDGADEGAFIESHGTVTTNQFVIIDTFKDPGHSIKGYYIKNDGPNNILYAHNLTLDSNTGIEAFEVDSSTIRFATVRNGEIESATYNRNKIKNIYLLASGGDSDYRLKVVW